MSIETHFNDIQTNIILELNKANRQILLAVAWLTDETLFNKLCQKADDLVDVQIIIVNDEINRNSGIDYEKLIKIGGKVYWQENLNSSLMHHKFCVIDSATVITGSYNWTRKANSNIENIIILKNEIQSAKQYYDEFKSLVPRFEEANFFDEGYKSAEYFDTPEKRLRWYNNLPDDVKETFTYYGRQLIWTYDDEGYVILNENLDENIAAIFRVKELIYSGSDLKYLENLSNLESLIITNDSQCLDLTPLKNLIRLKELKIYGNNVSNLHPLNKLKKIENLNLSNNNISSLKGIENLNKLKYLDISGNNINSLDELSYLTTLIDLRLNRNSINNLYPISKNISLERLEFSDNIVEDIEPMRKFVKMKTLAFSNNKVNYVSEKLHFPKLEHLSVEGNPLSREDIFSFKKQIDFDF
jgi:Leucine-rich repeat (LRR) protein